MGKSNKDKGGNIQSFTQWIIVSVVLFAYFLLVLISYSNEMKNASSDVEKTQMAYHASSVASRFSNELAAVEQATRTVAASIAVDNVVLSERSYELLQGAVDSSGAVFGYVADSEGNAVDIKGNSFSVWENGDYAQALTGVQLISEIGDMESGAGTIAFYAPVSDKGTMTGVVCLQYPAEQFTQLAPLADYDGQTTYCLMRNNGTIVCTIGGTRVVDVDTSLFDVITDVRDHARNSEVKRFRQNVEGKKTAQALAVIDGKEYFLNSVPVEINSWNVLEIHSGQYYAKATERFYDPTKRVLLRLFIALFLFLAAVIILNILNKTLYNRNAMELQNRADMDLLTGLFNKMATERRIQEHLEGQGKDEPAMLCVLDIDNFKKINDTLGHAFGDQVLATLGVKLKAQFRSSDIIGRIGGDEFIVFLKKIPNDDIMNKEADKLMTFFKDFKAGDYVKYSATASVGVAMYPEDGKTFEQLYKAADKGVYHSKQQGKNQLTLYRDIK